MARTWLVTDSFPRICPALNLVPVRENKYGSLSKHTGCPTSYKPVYSFPKPTISNQGTLEAFLLLFYFTIKLFPTPLPTFEFLSNYKWQWSSSLLEQALNKQSLPAFIWLLYSFLHLSRLHKMNSV